MVRESEIRPAEIAVTPPPATDAGLVFIGRIHTPWTSRMVTPRQGRVDGPLCRIEIFEPWVAALDGTPLLDLKPDRTLFTPIAPPQPGDFQIGDQIPGR